MPTVAARHHQDHPTVTEELPIAHCDLDPPGLDAQRERYRRLADSVIGLERRPGRLLAQFRPDVDRALVEETLAVESRCCPFFRLEFDPSARRLEIAVDRAEEDPALDALRFALSHPLRGGYSTGPGARRR